MDYAPEIQDEAVEAIGQRGEPSQMLQRTPPYRQSLGVSANGLLHVADTRAAQSPGKLSFDARYKGRTGEGKPRIKLHQRRAGANFGQGVHSGKHPADAN